MFVVNFIFGINFIFAVKFMFVVNFMFGTNFMPGVNVWGKFHANSVIIMSAFPQPKYMITSFEIQGYVTLWNNMGI